MAKVKYYYDQERSVSKTKKEKRHSCLVLVASALFGF
jgi:hypothetical protein